MSKTIERSADVCGEKKIRIAPSLLAANFANLEKELDSIREADLLHYDVMDGDFVPNLAFGLSELECISAICPIPIDVHLMISHPEKYVCRFVRAGARIVTVHVESRCEDLGACLRLIRESGALAGIALNPDTPIEAVYPYLDVADLILIMTVQPGFGGQKCREDCFEKARILRDELRRRGIERSVEADGGLGESNAAAAIAAGIDTLVAGSAVFRSENRSDVIRRMRGL